MTNAAAAVRGAVKVNGEIITGWAEIEIDNNSYASADTFSCKFASNFLPADRNTAWFSEQQDMYVDLYMGTPANPNSFSANELPHWIYGKVDQIHYAPEEGCITVSGRDLTRLFIDAKTTEKFQNKTSSQVAQILAARHNLTAQVVPTTTPVGKYYEIDHERMNDARTEWDILTYLARIEQYIVYVRGQTLFFQPKQSPTASPFPVVYTPPDPVTGYPTCNVIAPQFKRALTVSRGIIVTVRSFNDAAQKVFTSVYPPKQAKSAAPGQSAPFGGAQAYFYNMANLSQQAVLQMAQMKYAEIVQHEMLFDFELPGVGNDSLDVTSVISLTGTGTAWDQTYYPDSIKRSLSFEGGYHMEVNSKNHSPDSQEVTQ